MLTLFAVPKPFQGHIGTIQRNALASWLALRHLCQVVLFGNEEGVAEAARAAGAEHVPAVARNEFGTPLLDDVFGQAARRAGHELLCYVNADVILGGDLLPAVRRVQEAAGRFLVVGQCWNLDVREPLQVADARWEEELLAAVRQRGRRRPMDSKDYFVFPRGLYGPLPPFALGRAHFDSWLVWRALALKVPVVDATLAVAAIHQNHGYAHLGGGYSESMSGIEARRNLALCGGRRHCRTIGDATYRLTPAALERQLLRSRLRLAYRRDQLRRLPKQLLQASWWLLNHTRPLRHALGLHMGTVQRLKRLAMGR